MVESPNQQFKTRRQEQHKNEVSIKTQLFCKCPNDMIGACCLGVNFDKGNCLFDGNC